MFFIFLREKNTSISILHHKTLRLDNRNFTPTQDQNDKKSQYEQKNEEEHIGQKIRIDNKRLG